MLNLVLHTFASKASSIRMFADLMSLCMILGWPACLREERTGQCLAVEKAAD
jgi:hypothetical protein